MGKYFHGGIVTEFIFSSLFSISDLAFTGVKNKIKGKLFAYLHK